MIINTLALISHNLTYVPTYKLSIKPPWQARSKDAIKNKVHSTNRSENKYNIADMKLDECCLGNAGVYVLSKSEFYNLGYL